MAVRRATPAVCRAGVGCELPKTRSGKNMRRLLRDVAEKRPVGDVTTLADSSIMELISAGKAGSTED